MSIGPIAAVLAPLLLAPALGWGAVLDYQAQLTLDVGSIPSIVRQASGSILVSGEGSFVFPRGVFRVTTVGVPPQTVDEVVASALFHFENATGMFGGPSLPGGAMSLDGTANVRLRAAGFPPFDIPMSPIGADGTAVGIASNGATTARFELRGDVWRTGIFHQSGFTSGSTFSVRTNTGFDARTARGGGTLQLVVPATVHRTVDGEFDEQNPVTAVLRITFMPEPDRALLLGAAFGAALSLGRRATRRRLRRSPCVAPAPPTLSATPSPRSPTAPCGIARPRGGGSPDARGHLDT